jgi:uncharacterized membrane protein
MKKISSNLPLKSNKNGYALAIAIALLTASVLFGIYYVALPVQDGYMTIYLLDYQRSAVNYPERLVNGENNTFSVYVEVENHVGVSQSCQVQVKVVSDMNPTFPVDTNATLTFNGTVENSANWENVATLSLNKAGDYSVVFELWSPNKNTGVLEYSGNFCLLNVQVVDKPTSN